MGFLLFLSILLSGNTVGRHTFMRTPTDYTFNFYLHPCKQLQHWPSLWPRLAHTSGKACPWMNRPTEEFLPDPAGRFRATRTGNLGVLWIWIMDAEVMQALDGHMSLTFRDSSTTWEACSWWRGGCSKAGDSWKHPPYPRLKAILLHGVLGNIHKWEENRFSKNNQGHYCLSSVYWTSTLKDSPPHTLTASLPPHSLSALFLVFAAFWQLWFSLF